MEHEIWWQVKAGTSSFWFDNWTKIGALYFATDSEVRDEDAEVMDFTNNGKWNTTKLQEVLPEEMDSLLWKVSVHLLGGSMVTKLSG